MAKTAVRPRRSELALILAAERLFAERGIASVSLREINQAAQQRNISAAHYHFGSREGLVEAVLQHRLPRLDQRRGALLHRPGQHRDVRFYLEAFVLPLVEELAPREEGNHYLRFIRDYERAGVDYPMAKRASPEGVAIFAALERLIHYLPDDVRRLRLNHLINLIHAVLAKAEEQIARGEIAHGEVALIATDMIDMFAAALSAPLSAATIDLLQGG